MPEFILNRNYALRSIKGHIINFIKGEPVYVPPVLVAEAVALGAESVDGPIDPLEPEAPVKSELTLAEREQAMREAIEQMVAANNREDFTAQGTPNLKALSGYVGFTVNKRELEGVWQKYLNEKAGVE